MKKLTLILLTCYTLTVVASYSCATLKAQNSSLYYSNANNIDDSIPYKVSEDTEDADNTPIISNASERNLFIAAAVVLFAVAVGIIIKTKPTHGR